MSVDQRSSGAPSPARNYQARQWMAAYRRHDRDAFATIVRHLEYRVVSYLYWKHDLTLDQSCGLTRETLEHAWERVRDGERPKDLLPWLYEIADNRRPGHSQRFGTAVPARTPDADAGPNADADADADAGPESDLRIPDLLAGTEIDLDQHLPIWLELMHDAIDSMPAPLRETIGAFGTLIGRDGLGAQRGDSIATLAQRLKQGDVTASRFAEVPDLGNALDTMLQTAGVQLMARTRRTDCASFNMCLSDAGWEDGPFGAELQPLLQHVGICDQGECTTIHITATTLAGQLPVVVLLLAVGLEEQHRQFVEAVYAAEAPGPAHSVANAVGAEQHAAALPIAPIVPTLPLAQLASSGKGLSTQLVTRLAQLPGIRAAAEVVQQYPQVAQYAARGTAATVIAAVITVATVSSGPSGDVAGSPGSAPTPTSGAEFPLDSGLNGAESGISTPTGLPNGPTDPASPLLSGPGGTLLNLPGDVLGSVSGGPVGQLPGQLLGSVSGGPVGQLPGQLLSGPGEPVGQLPGQLLSGPGTPLPGVGDTVRDLPGQIPQVLPDVPISVPAVPPVGPLPSPIPELLAPLPLPDLPVLDPLLGN